MAMNKKNIKFLGVSSGICAPTARGKIGAELGFDAIRAYALSAKIPESNKQFDARKLFTKNYTYNGISFQTEEIIFAADLYSYIKKKGSFFNDLSPQDKIDGNFEFARHINYAFEIFPKIRDEVKNVLQDKKEVFPFIIAGDHSTAAATISGIVAYLEEKNELLNKDNPPKKLGVLWVDAHVDAHSPYSTPSGNLHGMPVGMVLGLTDNYYTGKALSNREKLLESIRKIKKKTFKGEWNKLLNILNEEGKKEDATPSSRLIEPEQLAFIGIRSYEKHELALLKDENIKYYHLTRKEKVKSGEKATKFGQADLDRKNNELWDKVNPKDKSHLRNIGLEEACQDILYKLKGAGCTDLYVSFDIDSIDGNLVPGTGTPEPYGLKIKEAKRILSYIWKQDIVPLMAMELVEVNPLLDRANKTAKVAFDIIKTLVEHK
ncbi:MAG: rocF [Flavipsychrobacter sp.]|jgi:arginase|nr:rocF [Flavipsychrobacter sp.]